MSRRNVDLGSGSVGKLLFSLAVPTITSQIVNMLYNLVDRVYIGHMQPVETVGKLALTGVGVCLPIIMVISAFAALMAFGGAPRASIAEGRGDLKESERIMGNSFTMLVAVSVVLTVVFLVFAEPMLRIFGASDNTIGYALNYMRIYALGTIFVQVTLGMNAYITAQGFTVVGMKTVLIPKDNEPDLYEVDDEVKKNLTFLPMQNLTQVLNAALLKPTSAKKTKAPASRSRKKAPAGESLVPPAAEKPQPGAVC